MFDHGKGVFERNKIFKNGGDGVRVRCAASSWSRDRVCGGGRRMCGPGPRAAMYDEGVERGPQPHPLGHRYTVHMPLKRANCGKVDHSPVTQQSQSRPVECSLAWLPPPPSPCLARLYAKLPPPPPTPDPPLSPKFLVRVTEGMPPRDVFEERRGGRGEGEGVWLEAPLLLGSVKEPEENCLNEC